METYYTDLEKETLSAIERIFSHIDMSHWPLVEVRNVNNISSMLPVSDEFSDDLKFAKKLLDKHKKSN